MNRQQLAKLALRYKGTSKGDRYAELAMKVASSLKWSVKKDKFGNIIKIENSLYDLRIRPPLEDGDYWKLYGKDKTMIAYNRDLKQLKKTAKIYVDEILIPVNELFYSWEGDPIEWQRQTEDIYNSWNPDRYAMQVTGASARSLIKKLLTPEVVSTMERFDWVMSYVAAQTQMKTVRPMSYGYWLIKSRGKWALMMNDKVVANFNSAAKAFDYSRRTPLNYWIRQAEDLRIDLHMEYDL